MKGTRLLAIAAGAAMAVSAGPATADKLELLSLSPATSAALSGVTGGGALTPTTNAVEVTFSFELTSADDGRIDVYTAGVPGNPAHTGLEMPIWVKKGKGHVNTRFSVKCTGMDVLISKIRYTFYKQAPGGPAGGPLVPDRFKEVKYQFNCKGGVTHPDGPKKPDISFLRKGVYTWGSDPTKKHWADWGTTVTLTAAESISPKVGSGPCRFNVEYYPKELNGVATGPFKNGIQVDGPVVASDGPMTLAGNAFADRTRVLSLPPGSGHALDVALDNRGAVVETDEGNNLGAIRFTLEGSCTGKPGPAGKP
jgi:hypothetical protein